MGTVSKKFGFIRATLAMWTGNLFAGRAGVVTDSTPGPVERWGWWDGSAWKFSARSGASETFSALSISGLSQNIIPRVVSGSGLLGASALSDNGTAVSSGLPVRAIADRTANGAHLIVGGAAAGNAGYMAFGRGSDGAQGILIGYVAGVSESLELRFQSGGADGAWQSWYTRTSGGTATEKMRLSTVGGLSVGVTTDPGAGGVNLLKGIGFFGTSAPTSKPSVTGSRGGNAALASLLTALNACGLITDSTTA